MNPAPHTPGPWAYQAFDTEKGVVFDISQVDADISQVDVAYTYSHEANARLIAAAPDLFAACQEFIAYGNNDATDGVAMMVAYNNALRSARAAIAKATGETS